MTCERWQEAISARLDGEDPGIEPRLVDAHLTGCTECSRFAQLVQSGAQGARVVAAPEMPDLSRRLSRLNAAADRTASWSIGRILLAVVALDVIAFAARDLLGGGSRDTVHAARHLGAFSAAYGIGLLVVVVRPARARTMLPVAAVLSGALAMSAVVDLVEDNIPLLNEATHLPELISVFLLWRLAVPRDPTKQQQGQRRKSDRRLHAA